MNTCIYIHMYIYICYIYRERERKIFFLTCTYDLSCPTREVTPLCVCQSVTSTSNSAPSYLAVVL